jgi:hypothetical protein
MQSLTTSLHVSHCLHSTTDACGSHYSIRSPYQPQLVALAQQAWSMPLLVSTVSSNSQVHNTVSELALQAVAFARVWHMLRMVNRYSHHSYHNRSWPWQSQASHKGARGLIGMLVACTYAF